MNPAWIDFSLMPLGETFAAVIGTVVWLMWRLTSGARL